MNRIKRLTVTLLLSAFVLFGGVVDAQNVGRIFLEAIDDSTTTLRFGRYRIELRGPSDTATLTPTALLLPASVRAVIYEVDTLGLGSDSGIPRAVLMFTDSLGTTLWRNDTLPNGDLIILMSRNAGVNWDTVYTGVGSGGGTTDSTRVGYGLKVKGTAGDSIAAPADTIYADTSVLATKGHAENYADTAIGDTVGDYLNRGGGQMTGNITMAGAQLVDGKDVSTLTDIGQTVGTSEIENGAVTDAKIDSLDPDKLEQDAASTGQVLKWNGTAWQPGTDNTAGASADSALVLMSHSGTYPFIKWLNDSTFIAADSIHKDTLVFMDSAGTWLIDGYPMGAYTNLGQTIEGDELGTGLKDSITDGQTAHGWADHSVQGYITDSKLSDSSIILLNATAWRLFYSNATPTAIQELGFGANGTYLKSNGASLAPIWASVPSGWNWVDSAGRGPDSVVHADSAQHADLADSTVGVEAGADVTGATNVNAAGAVMESDFNATTFLYATTNNTPQPKTPAETRAILNVEDGATADQTDAEIEALIGPFIDTTTLDTIEYAHKAVSSDSSGKALQDASGNVITSTYATPSMFGPFIDTTTLDTIQNAHEAVAADSSGIAADAYTAHKDKDGDTINVSAYVTTESDPVYIADPAFGITAADTTGWNKGKDSGLVAWNWGDHSVQNYINSLSELYAYFDRDYFDTTAAGSLKVVFADSTLGAERATKDGAGNTITTTYEVQLNNEDGLYAVLSNVSNFVQDAEVPGLETDATALAAVGDTINARMTKAVTGNTETRIEVTYNSTDSTTDYVVDFISWDTMDIGDSIEYGIQSIYGTDTLLMIYKDTSGIDDVVVMSRPNNDAIEFRSPLLIARGDIVLESSDGGGAGYGKLTVGNAYVSFATSKFYFGEAGAIELYEKFAGSGLVNVVGDSSHPQLAVKPGHGIDTTGGAVKIDTANAVVDNEAKPVTGNAVFEFCEATQDYLKTSENSDWNWDDSASDGALGPYWVDSAKHADSANHADSALYADTAGYVDSASYADSAGGVNPFIAGELTVTGPITRYNLGLALDTVNIFCEHADTFLRLPIDTNVIVNPEDSFQMMHPSPIKIPGGKWGYTYWFAGTPPAVFGEDIHILVSNDEETWTEFITDTGGVTCTLHNPVFSTSDFDSATYTSDPKILWNENGNLFTILRVTRSINGKTIHYLYSSATDDGIDWSDTVMIIDGYYNKGSDIFPDTGTLNLVSPGVIMRGAGDYFMYTSEDTNGGTKFTRVAWEAPRIDTTWDNASGFDSTRKYGGATEDTVRISLVHQTLPDGNMVFHADEIIYGADFIVNLVGSYSGSFYPRIYMGISTDGEYFTTVSTVLLDTTNNSTAWDHDIVYKAGGYFVGRGTEVILRMYYCGADNDGDWYTGITNVHFGNVLHQRELLIWGPDLITDTVPIFEVDSTKYPGGIKIQSVAVQTSIDGTYVLKFMSFTAADPPVFHDWVDTLNVGASDQRASSITFEDDDSPLIDRGQELYMLTPSTDIAWIKVRYKFFVRDWQ